MPGIVFVSLPVLVLLVLVPVIPAAVAGTLRLGGLFPISVQPQIFAAANLAVQAINNKTDGISLRIIKSTVRFMGDNSDCDP